MRWCYNKITPAVLFPSLFVFTLDDVNAWRAEATKCLLEQRRDKGEEVRTTPRSLLRVIQSSTLHQRFYEERLGYIYDCSTYPTIRRRKASKC